MAVADYFEYAGEFADFNVDPGLLSDLSFQRVDQVLTRFDATTRHRPQSCGQPLTSLHHEHRTVGNDNRPDGDLGPVLLFRHAP